MDAVKGDMLVTGVTENGGEDWRVCWRWLMPCGDTLAGTAEGRIRLPEEVLS